jgi:oligopeptide/dipeptide ABC transporter ATP-binding protein
MYLGRIVEIGDTAEIFANPRHPYTQALLKAIPEPDPSSSVARDLPRGEIPDAANPPLGCSFHPRCPVATSVCGWEARDLRALLEEHWTRRDARTYEVERTLVGDLDHLDAPSTAARIGSGPPEQVRVLLEQIREENPDEPLWRGIAEIDVSESDVVVQFHEGVDPALRTAGGAEVACVLYGDENPQA